MEPCLPNAFDVDVDSDIDIGSPSSQGSGSFVTNHACRWVVSLKFKFASLLLSNLPVASRPLLVPRAGSQPPQSGRRGQVSRKTPHQMRLKIGRMQTAQGTEYFLWSTKDVIEGINMKHGGDSVSQNLSEYR